MRSQRKRRASVVALVLILLKSSRTFPTSMGALLSGVILVTGFTTLRHPLLRGQGFYTLDGERARIFTMPFKGHGGGRRGAGSEGVYGVHDDERNVDDDVDAVGDGDGVGGGGDVPMLTMWQISVRVSEEEARSVATAPRQGPGGAKEFVERITR